MMIFWEKGLGRLLFCYQRVNASASARLKGEKKYKTWYAKTNLEIFHLTNT